MAARQLNGFVKHVAGLADGTYHVVGTERLAAAEVLYFVMSLVQGGTYEVGHASIDDDKLLVCALLDIEGASDE